MSGRPPLHPSKTNWNRLQNYMKQTRKQQGKSQILGTPISMRKGANKTYKNRSVESKKTRRRRRR